MIRISLQVTKAKRHTSFSSLSNLKARGAHRTKTTTRTPKPTNKTVYGSRGPTRTVRAHEFHCSPGDYLFRGGRKLKKKIPVEDGHGGGGDCIVQITGYITCYLIQGGQQHWRRPYYRQYGRYNMDLQDRNQKKHFWGREVNVIN